MKRIPLSSKYRPARAYALVDDEDFQRFGAVYWTLTGSGELQYANRNVGGRIVYLHRVICDLQPNDGKTVDHINGDGLDNRRANLRVVTTADNMRNRRPRAFGTSQYRGVYWNKGRAKWCARAKVNYRHLWLGAFEDEHAAGRAVQDFWRDFDGRALDAERKAA